MKFDEREPLDLRLAVPAVVAWLVLAIVAGAPVLFVPLALVSGSLCLFGVGLAIRWRDRTPAAVSVAMLTLTAVAAVCASAAWQGTTQRPAELEEAASSSRQVTAIVELQSLSGAGPTGASIRELDWPDQAITGLDVPVVVFGAGSGMEPGTRIRVTGTMVAAEPGGRAAYLLFVRGEPELVAEAGGLLAATAALRAGLSAAAGALPGSGGGLLPGLALGDTRAVSAELDAAMKTTSLSHLTAVSGSNCAVVVGLVMLGGAALRWRRGIRVLVSLLVLAGFVVLVTPDASVLRAAVMASIVLIAALRGRLSAGIPTLAAAVIALLAWNPWFARDYGFALSVLATAGLLVLAPPLAVRLGRYLPGWLAVVIAVPLAAQLACQPVLILLQPSIPVYGVIANLLCQLAAPIATVLGLIACLVLPVVDPLGRALTVLAWLPAAWIASVAETISVFPFARAPWWDGVLGVVAIVVVTAGFLVWVFRPRRALTIVLAACLVVYLGALGGKLLGDRAALMDDWQFAICPVGQGDALVVRSEGRVALIDTGPDATLVEHCLDRLGVDRIELLVLTHFDLDHIGGSAAVIGRVDWLLAGPTDARSDAALLERFESAGARRVPATAGLSGVLGGLNWRVLWPPAPPSAVTPGNDASVVLGIEPGPACTACLSGLLLGDLSAEAQFRLLGHASPQRVDVVKVSHHGSADQASALYERIAAPIALIGVGENRYGHPAPAILDLLDSMGSTVARTDTDGLILVGRTPDGELAVWKERAETDDGYGSDRDGPRQ